MSEVVTGEAVVVEVRVAQLSSRALAFLIDWLIQMTLLIGVYLLVAYASPIVDDALAVGLNILLTVLVIVAYPVAFETISRGRSVGKLALGLRVVSDDGGPERFRQALFRGLAGFVEFWMFAGAPALITSLANEKGKRLGDVFSGTIVIGERGPRQSPPPVMPPHLASWAATLELSQLTDELAGAARQYLSRWHQLAPAVQHEMGTRISAQVMSRVTPPPPPGVPPHAYLAAVLAERRRRTEIRLTRAQARRSTMPPAYGTPSAYGIPGAYGTSGAYGATPAPAAAHGPGQAPPPGPTPEGFVPPT
ncbi:RDD family protein [Sphaerimonospora thailandensis]|uniref:RDD family protein n=1 Tax=Sphaerimonospora thailandensis TaxID=795644 RepID=UPI0019515D8B|nr:RDD family protein [Sphaerimonospora thailandensis]